MISRNQGENKLTAAVLSLRKFRGNENKHDEKQPDYEKVDCQTEPENAHDGPAEQQDPEEKKKKPDVFSHTMLPSSRRLSREDNHAEIT